MKKYLFITCGLALMVSAATVLAGCSSDNEIEEIIEPEPQRIELPTYYIPKDTLVGKWELVKQGSEEWIGEKTSLVLNEDGTVVFSVGDDVQFGTYTFPYGETCSRILGANVFEITSTVKWLGYEVSCRCYLWPDSARFYDNNFAYCGDHSHLYVRIKE